MFVFFQPSLFESHSDWKELFSDPLIRAIESDSVEQEQQLVERLHSILRPFLLRRLKREVEGQMPSKYEHVVKCSLTRRQRVSLGHSNIFSPSLDLRILVVLFYLFFDV